MKVTTELKNIVKNAFSEKATAYRKRKCEEFHKEYLKARAWIENSKEYQEYVAARDRLLSMLEVDMETHNRSSDRPTPYYYKVSVKDKISPATFIGENNYSYGFDRDEELTKLEKEQNALLVKLTYEKDMDRIQALLADYGIEI